MAVVQPTVVQPVNPMYTNPMMFMFGSGILNALGDFASKYFLNKYGNTPEKMQQESLKWGMIQKAPVEQRLAYARQMGMEQQYLASLKNMDYTTQPEARQAYNTYASAMNNIGQVPYSMEVWADNIYKGRGMPQSVPLPNFVPGNASLAQYGLPLAYGSPEQTKQWATSGLLGNVISSPVISSTPNNPTVSTGKTAPTKPTSTTKSTVSPSKTTTKQVAPITNKTSPSKKKYYKGLTLDEWEIVAPTDPEGYKHRFDPEPKTKALLPTPIKSNQPSDAVKTKSGILGPPPEPIPMTSPTSNVYIPGYSESLFTVS